MVDPHKFIYKYIIWRVLPYELLFATHNIDSCINFEDNIQRSTSYLFLHVEIDNGGGGRGRLKTKHYDKRNGITFPKVNSFSSVAMSLHHQRMEFTFHN
jgi:hypothetical protein